MSQIVDGLAVDLDDEIVGTEAGVEGGATLDHGGHCKGHFERGMTAELTDVLDGEVVALLAEIDPDTLQSEPKA